MSEPLYFRLVQRASHWIDSSQPASGAPPKTLGRFLGWALAGSWGVIAIAALISGIVGSSEVLAMYLLGRVVDIASAGGGFAGNGLLLAFAALIMLGVRPVLYGLSAIFQSVVLGPNLFKLVLSRLNHWTLGQSVTFFDNDFAGRLAQKQMQTANSATEIVIETVNAILFALASVIGAAILVWLADPRLLLLLGVWMAAYLGFLSFFLPRIRVRAKARAGAKADVSGQVVDTITNIKTVKLFAGGTYEEAAAVGSMGTLRARAIDFGAVSSVFRFGLIGLAGLLPVTMVGLALYWSQSGAITPGQIAAIGAVAIRLSQMTGWVSFVLMAIYSHLGEVEDGMRTLTPSHMLVDSPGATDLVVANAEIRFEDVNFGYGRDTGGINDIQLTVRSGEKLGIVGASGAGKSTLVSLLLRLYDAESGRVLIDGQDVTTVTQESLRRSIGMVTQETSMFNRTVRENISYGLQNASQDEVEEAARRAESHEFIQTLEDHAGRQGYEAHVGERGVKLSGGQRQRIALARAMLKDAPILVLDEATSALDSEVEAAIQLALGRVMEGKTVLAIAHRLSTIAHMDRIIVLENGQIVEEGTHTDLLGRAGVYARYWNRQSGGFLGARNAAE